MRPTLRNPFGEAAAEPAVLAVVLRNMLPWLAVAGVAIAHLAPRVADI